MNIRPKLASFVHGKRYRGMPKKRRVDMLKRDCAHRGFSLHEATEIVPDLGEVMKKKHSCSVVLTLSEVVYGRAGSVRRPMHLITTAQSYPFVMYCLSTSRRGTIEFARITEHNGGLGRKSS